jgi:hypothetical protein
MANVTMYIGLNAGILGDLSDEEAIKTTGAVLEAYGIDAMTISPAYGIWRSYREQTLRVELIGVNANAAKEAARAIARTLYQECILVVIDGHENLYVSGHRTHHARRVAKATA